MILVDTGAWYAVCDASDTNHQRAKAFYEKVAGVIPLVTTDAILVDVDVAVSSAASCCSTAGSLRGGYFAFDYRQHIGKVRF